MVSHSSGKLRGRAERSGGAGDEDVGAVGHGQVGWPEVPGVLAVDHREPPQARREGTNRLALGEVAAFVEGICADQVDLAMGVYRLAVGEVEQRVVVATVSGVLCEPDDDVHVAASRGQSLELRRLQIARDRRHAHGQVGS